MESFLNPLIASYFPEEESEYRVEVTSWPLLSKGAADGFQKDLASGDFFILPLSFFILAYTVGSIAVVVFGTLPISFMYVMLFFFFVSHKKKKITPFSHSPGTSSIGLTMHITSGNTFSPHSL